MKISIITAVYNSENTVQEAIESVAVQKYVELEHVIVEGNSNDGSLGVIEGAAHSRMRLISEPDLGIYDALNKGIRYSTGEIVGFMHSDDFFAHDEVLLKVADAFKDPDVEAVFSDLDYVSQSDSSFIVRHWSAGHFDPRLLKYGWMPPHPTLYLRREVYDRFGTYDTSFSIAADYDFILRYFSQSPGKSAYIPEVLYKMRLGGISNKSLSKVKKKMKEDYCAIRRNRIGGAHTLVLKNFSKLKQLIVPR
ncbi:glycosyltransferase family 2 protein [Haliea atlantica]